MITGQMTFSSHARRQAVLERNNLERPPPKEDPGERLAQLASASQQPIIRIKTAIPLNPFPSELVVDCNKINIIHSSFFNSGRVEGILIREVQEVTIETSILFATLRIFNPDIPNQNLSLSYLKKGEAIKARKIIEGLMVAHKSNIDISKLETENIAKQAEILGSAEEDIGNKI